MLRTSSSEEFCSKCVRMDLIHYNSIQKTQDLVVIWVVTIFPNSRDITKILGRIWLETPHTFCGRWRNHHAVEKMARPKKGATRLRKESEERARYPWKEIVKQNRPQVLENVEGNKQTIIITSSSTHPRVHLGWFRLLQVEVCLIHKTLLRGCVK